MLFSQRLGVVLIVAMHLPGKSTFSALSLSQSQPSEQGDFCQPPGNDSCLEMLGTLTVRQGEPARWSSLQKLHGRLVIEGRKVLLPALTEIVGKPPLVVVRTGGVQLPRLKRLVALDNSSSTETMVKIEGKVSLDTETLVRLNETSNGKVTVDGMSLEEFVWQHSPRDSDYLEVVFIMLCVLSSLLLPYAIVKALHSAEIRVLDCKVHDDLALMKSFLLDRRREKLSRLDAYVDHENEPNDADDLHKILGIPVPKKATGLPYRHDPMRSEQWAEECEMRCQKEIDDCLKDFLEEEDKDDEVADLRLERHEEDKSMAHLMEKKRQRPMDRTLRMLYRRARETSEDRAKKEKDVWDQTPYDEDIGEEELGRWEKM